MRCLTYALALIFLIATSAYAQNAEAAIDAIERREYAAAIDALRQFENADRPNFLKGNYDYLLARLYEFAGDTAAALPLYQAASARTGPTRPYALTHLARIMHDSGNLFLERVYLDQLLSAGDAAFRASARLHLARNAERSGNARRAVQVAAAAGKGKISEFLRDDTALLAQWYLHAGDAARGHAILVRLIDETPNPDAPDDATLSAIQTLDAIETGTDLGEEEHLKRAKIYQFNREFAAARLHLEAVVSRYADSANAPNAILDIARGFSQLSEYVEALKWFERVQERYPESTAAKDALLLGSAGYGRVGKYREAITRYQRFIEKFPADERLDRAYLNAVDLLRDQGDDSEAQKWALKTRERFAGKLPETLALFSEARIFLSRGEWRSALDKLDSLESRHELGGAQAPGGTTRGEIQFLRAFVLEQLARYGEAIDQYLAIPDGRAEYYGGRSTDRLKGVQKIDAAQAAILARLASASEMLKSRSAPDRRRGALNVIRLTDSSDIRSLAIGVLRQAIPASSLPAEVDWKSLIDALRLDDRGGEEVEQATVAAESAWRNIPIDVPTSIVTSSSMRELYSAPFAASIVKYAQRNGVDPRLMLAIMRQESRFAVDAKSASAARGLMQFISSAATRTGTNLGIENLDQRELYSPSMSIFLGARYLADLGMQFPQQAEAVVASYNGGPDNVKRWVARSRSGNADRFVPEIQFGQTKDYVQKVMAGYRVYRELYDEKLRPRVTNAS